jgi:hypothetical protein
MSDERCHVLKSNIHIKVFFASRVEPTMSFDFVPGEEVIVQAKLRKNAWMKHRRVTCGIKCCSSCVYLGPFTMLGYCLFGGSCRQEEVDSFELVLTNKNIYCKQMSYKYGTCCQTSGTITIPLEKIQDVQIISDWVGDCCGIVEQKGDVYQLHVQTAAMGGFAPELVVFCIDDIREFKKKVIEARNALKVGNQQASQPKHTDQTSVAQALASVPPEELARVLALLSRQVTPTTTESS